MCRLLLFIAIIFCNYYALGLNVKFTENHAAKLLSYDTHIFKRELTQFFDKAAYSFNGLTKYESVPVLFPLDICVLNVEGVKYATALHKHKNGAKHFAVYQYMAKGYQSLLELHTPSAIALDCVSFAGRGYIALSFNHTQPIVRAREGSPIYEISPTAGVRAIQYFAGANLRAMYLRVSGQDLTLLQAFSYTTAEPNLHCPFFKWSGTSFNRVGRIPCSNARRLEPFTIEYEHYVAVANYADERGVTATNSEIYKYNATKNRFDLFQRIRTNGAIDVKYFSVPLDEIRRNHFLIFGNSFSESDYVLKKPGGAKHNSEADSVFYVFDKNQFVPYQSLSFYAVERFLPVQNMDPEKFLLLVACNKQDTKIYNLNDWKFEESKVQFTEGALSRGVAKMRTYEENEQTYLVIANELMADNETNIFLPIYKQDEHANALRQQIIEWAARENERLASIDVAQLQEAVKQKLPNMGTKPKPTRLDISNVHIQQVTTKTFNAPQHKFNDKYWQALAHAKRALDVMEREIVQRKNQQMRSKRAADTVLEQHEFDEVDVDTLIVHEQLHAKRINGVDSKQPAYEQINAAKVYVTGSYQMPIETTTTNADTKNTNTNATHATAAAAVADEDNVLNIENLQITGKLNGHTWLDLVNNTLKRSGVQFIKSEASFDKLTAEAVVVTNNAVSGQQLGQLVPINGGDYIVQQDVRFAAPVQAKSIRINERLNNIHVTTQKFDVLLKQANWTQVIDAPKRIERLKVLEPITLTGHMVGHELRAMAPMKVLHKDIQLTGDFTIDGDVTIDRLLSAWDISDTTLAHSLSQRRDNGVRIDQPIAELQVKFVAPVKANNTLVDFINAHDMQHLLQLNAPTVQMVEGMKTLPNGLTVRQGFSEVKKLNGIDVELLEEQLLLKDTSQTINVPVHLGKVIGKSVQAADITLRKRKHTDYLRRAGAQHVNGTLYVGSLKAHTLHVHRLNTNGDIYGQRLSDIYKQKSKSAPNADLLFQSEQKFHGTIYVHDLWLNNTLNNVTVGEMERQLTQLASNVKFVGDFRFMRDMHFGSLHFAHSLNGIPSEDFGQVWLRRTAAQNFTAPQTIARVAVQKDLQLQGRLNAQEFTRFEQATYKLNTAEHIPVARFENLIELARALHTTHVNGLQVPEDMLRSKGSTAQTLQAPALLKGHLNAPRGGVHQPSSLNELPLVPLLRYLDGKHATLHLEHVQFAKAPRYRTLNQYNLKSLLDSVWLANENVALDASAGQVKMAKAYFDGLLDFEGTLNDVDLSKLVQYYFSRTRAQQIASTLHFARDVTLDDTLEAASMQLKGELIDAVSNFSFNFNDFVANTLKTAGPHQVSGQWRMAEAIIASDLKNVRINDLNLAHDVLQKNAKQTTIIYGEKRISSGAFFKKLYATKGALVADVPIAQWINDTVYIYENHTISGTTTLDTVNLYNDLLVMGTVNGQKFDEQNLLLRDREQHIQGDLLVRNFLPEDKTILTHNIDQLVVSNINGLSVQSLLEHRAHNRPNLHIASHLIFTQPLTVGNYQVAAQDAAANSDFKWKRGVLESTTTSDNLLPQLHTSNSLTWSTLNAHMQQLQRRLESPPVKLEHFVLRQHLPWNVSDTISLTLSIDGTMRDVIALRMHRPEHMQEAFEYIVWHEEVNKFKNDADLTWLPQDQIQLEILQLMLRHEEHMSVTQHGQLDAAAAAITADTPGLMAAFKRKQAKNLHLAAMSYANATCLALYGENSQEVPIYCVNATNANRVSIYLAAVFARANVRQLLAIGRDACALLLDADVLELWTIKQQLTLVQKLHIPGAKHITTAEHAGKRYLAVLKVFASDSLALGAVEIYSNNLQDTTYVLLQTIECTAPLQAALMALPEANDLLLHVLTAHQGQTLLSYQYKGVAGFVQIVSATTLPAAHHMQVFKMKAAGHYMTALMADDGIYFVQTMLKRI